MNIYSIINYLTIFNFKIILLICLFIRTSQVSRVSTHLSLSSIILYVEKMKKKKKKKKRVGEKKGENSCITIEFRAWHVTILWLHYGKLTVGINHVESGCACIHGRRGRRTVDPSYRDRASPRGKGAGISREYLFLLASYDFPASDIYYIRHSAFRAKISFLPRVQYDNSSPCWNNVIGRMLLFYNDRSYDRSKVDRVCITRLPFGLRYDRSLFKVKTFEEFQECWEWKKRDISRFTVFR